MATIDRYLPAVPQQPDRSAIPAQGMGHDEAQESSGFSINLTDLRAMAWRQRWLVAAIVLAALVIGVVVTLLMTPIYQATSTVQVRQEPSNIVEGQDVNPVTTIADTPRYLQTQEDLVRSRSMAQMVIDRLRLDRSDDFIVAMGGKPVAGTVPAANLQAVRRNIATGILQANVNTDIPQNSRVMQIGISGPAPVVITSVANAYAQSFIDNNIQTAFNSSSYARNFLADQIARARDRLAQAERQSIEYARDQQLIDASDAAASREENGQAAAGRSLTTASLVDLNTRLSTVQAQRIEAESRWQAAQSRPLLQIPEVVANAAVVGLQGQRATIAAQLNQLRARYRDDYPEVVQLQGQLNSINQQIDRIAGDVRGSLQSTYLAAQREEAQLLQAIGSRRGDALQEQRRRVQLNLLSQDVTTDRQILNDLLQRYNQVVAASGIVTNNLSLVDQAIVPHSPIRPNAMKNLLTALAIGIALGIGVALIREGFDDTVRAPEEVEEKLRLPVLGSVPSTAASELTMDNIINNPRLAISESYFSIRAALDFSTRHGRPRSILVTSSAPSEGKTTTSFALANDYARMGLRTLLVDCDLRRPGIHRMTQLPLRPGLVDVLSGSVPLEQAIKSVPNSTLSILTAGVGASKSVQIFSSGLLDQFLRDQEQHYDMIILDTAPVMGLADTPLIARSAEGIVLVVQSGRAHRGQAKNTLKRLRETGGQLLGVVLTKFDARAAGYGYSYYYSNYYNYESETA